MMDRPVAIIGKGMIGISLAVLFTGNRIPVIVYAKNKAAGLERYRAYYSDLIAQGLVTQKQAARCEELLAFTEDYADLSEVEIVIESVCEDLTVKQQVYREIETHCKKLKVLASTTSAMSPAMLAEGMRQKEKIVVAHPYNPPHMVPCVEVVKGDDTEHEAVEALVTLLESCGREVCRMNKPSPGFIANRLQIALYREAMHMVEQGICAPEDIDKCIRSSWAPRYTSIGLFDHFDYAGLDLISNVQRCVYPSLCNSSELQPMMRSCLEQGKFGYKTGVGVYDWRERDMEAFRQKTIEPYLQSFNWNLPEE